MTTMDDDDDDDDGGNGDGDDDDDDAQALDGACVCNSPRFTADASLQAQPNRAQQIART